MTKKVKWFSCDVIENATPQDMRDACDKTIAIIKRQRRGWIEDAIVNAMHEIFKEASQS